MLLQEATHRAHTALAGAVATHETRVQLVPGSGWLSAFSPISWTLASYHSIFNVKDWVLLVNRMPPGVLSFHAQTDAEKDDLRLKRTRLCGEEDAEEMHVRKAMGAALAPMVDDLLSDAETAGRLDFIIQKALFAVRYGGVKPELTRSGMEE